jgi:hypothetical protein
MKFAVSSIRTTICKAAAVIGVATLLAAPAQATLITYGDLASFTSKAGSTTLDNLDGWGGTYTVQSFSQATKDFTLTTFNSGDFNGMLSGGYPRMSGRFLAWQGSGLAPEFTFTFKHAITAFSFDWFNYDPTDNYQVVINGKSLQAMNYGSNGFFGVVATNGETFKTLTLKTQAFGGYVDYAGIDNLRYSTAAVSAPTTVATLGLGLLALVSRRRSK